MLMFFKIALRAFEEMNQKQSGEFLRKQQVDLAHVKTGAFV